MPTGASWLRRESAVKYDNDTYKRNLEKTFELIELTMSLRIAAIRKQFPAMSAEEAEGYFWREVREIKDAMLDRSLQRTPPMDNLK